MPSEANDKALRDIRDNILLAHEFIEGMTLDQFSSDIRTLYAVVRCLEIISEASRRLSADFKSRHPVIAWSKVAGAGNVYRHNYEDLTDEVIWNTVNSLESLLRCVQSELPR